MAATPREHELTATYILEQMDPNPQSREELLQMASGSLHEATPGVPEYSDIYLHAINALVEEHPIEVPATSIQGPDEYLYAQLLPDIMDTLGLEGPDDPQ